MLVYISKKYDNRSQTKGDKDASWKVSLKPFSVLVFITLYLFYTLYFVWTVMTTCEMSCVFDVCFDCLGWIRPRVQYRWRHRQPSHRLRSQHVYHEGHRRRGRSSRWPLKVSTSCTTNKVLPCVNSCRLFLNLVSSYQADSFLTGTCLVAYLCIVSMTSMNCWFSYVSQACTAIFLDAFIFLVFVLPLSIKISKRIFSKLLFDLK